MKEFCTITKKRTSYNYNGYTINLEDVKNFDPVIEIEKVSDSKEGIHKNNILKILTELDVPEKNIINKSITYLYMMENSVF